MEAAVLPEVKSLMYYCLLHFRTKDWGQEAEEIRNISVTSLSTYCPQIDVFKLK